MAETKSKSQERREAVQKSAVTKTLVIARTRNASHPGGYRIAGMYKFTNENRAALCTLDELAEIASDPHLFIEKRCGPGWFEALGLDYTEDNVKAYADIDPEVSPGLLAEKMKQAHATDIEKTEIEKQGDELIDRKAVIEALVKKGKKPGTDFDSNASLAVLKAL